MDKTNPDRYKIVKQVWDRPCEHPECETLHRNRSRFKWVTISQALDGRSHFVSWHDVQAHEWIILDKDTDERAFDGGAYDTKSEATYWLHANLQMLRNEAARALIA